LAPRGLVSGVMSARPSSAARRWALAGQGIAYKSALEKMADKPSASRELLQQKLDSLGEAA
jgi:hypothetical protein